MFLTMFYEKQIIVLTMLIAHPYPRHHYTTARVAEEFESFFLGGWFWLSSAPVAVHVFREVRATT